MQARGFQRWFSVIATASEAAPLLARWTVLVPEMERTVGRLQRDAASVYRREERLCSQRLLRANLNALQAGASTRALQCLTQDADAWPRLHAEFSRMVLLAADATAAAGVAAKSCRPGASPRQPVQKIKIENSKLKK